MDGFVHDDGMGLRGRYEAVVLVLGARLVAGFATEIV
jgi:hypothetical protein